MNYNVWRFPKNNHTDEKGLNTTDMETFMRDPMSSLAREICQNSIDAKRPECLNAIVEFKLFSINKKSIPGYERLREEIESCYNYRKNPDDKKTLKRMLESIEKDNIYCLRISDSNTTGLKSAFKDDESSSFYLLTHGSGLTSKVNEAGGSKGVGKYACFVASSFKTVFYSSLNEDGEEGFLGISKLCSTISKEDPTDKTQGIGYFSSDERNLPIPGQLNIQPGYKRETPGTDIYILGFDASDDWEKKIITMILDSFMVAIVFGELTIKFDSIEINKETVGAIVNSGYITNNKKGIKAQYDLLTGKENIYRETLTFPEIGDIKVFLKTYKREEAEEGTKQCVMVRYPHMKIRTMKKVSSVPCSAMCIIEQGAFNKSLIKIENPQHTDWEINRLKGPLKVEMSNRINIMEEGILNYIADTLSLGMEEQSDIEGAGEFLPSQNNGDFGEEKIIITEKPIVIPKRRAKIKDVNPVSSANDGSESDVVDVGDFDDTGDDTNMPNGKNDGNGGNLHETNNDTGHKEGDKEILRSAPLKGMKYVVFMPNRESGEQIISFTSLYNKENVELHLSYRDDSSGKYPTNIESASVNGVEANVKDGIIKNMNLSLGKNYVVKVKTDMHDYYRIEVAIYESK